MNTDSKNPSSPQSDVSPTSRLFDDWIDPIETGVRARVRDWIEALVHLELDTALQRPRYGRSTGGETEPAVAPVRGYRNGSRTRTLTGTFGKTDITVPRARLQGADGATTEWKSKALRAYQRRTKAADALIASADRGLPCEDRSPASGAIRRLQPGASARCQDGGVRRNGAISP